MSEPLNKRIEELMREAGYAAPELASRARKLAELIVQDCVEVVSEPTGDSEWDGYNNATANRLAEHFEVE